jgi:hypothetical protein
MRDAVPSIGMVMDDGPFPCGRTTVLLWADGRMSLGHYGASPAVPTGFTGTESVEMRDNFVHPWRQWEGGVMGAQPLLRPAELQCTDLGYMTAYTREHPPVDGRDEMPIELFGFDELGDINKVDWDAVQHDPEPSRLLRLLRCLQRLRRDRQHRHHSGVWGFASSLTSACGRTSWSVPAHRELWTSLRQAGTSLRQAVRGEQSEELSD